MRAAILLVMLAASASPAHAGTRSLGDCALSTVQAAVNAAADGDTIICPAGSWSWGGTVTINGPEVALQGAGAGMTILTATTSAALIMYAPAHAKGGELTGFSFRGGAVHDLGLVRFAGGTGFRVHHNAFATWGANQTGSGEGNSTAIYTSYQGAGGQLVAGVIDHNTFTVIAGHECSHAFLYVRNKGVNNASTEFALPSQITTGKNTLFVEDNTFVHGTFTCGGHQMHTLTTHAGAFVVFRHNHVTNGQIDFHGYCGTDGTREFQITDNVFDNTITGLYRWMFVRGGTGYIANNQRTGMPYTGGIELTDYRLFAPQYCVNSSLSRTIRGLAISPPNTCCNAKEGYTCMAQVGTGQVVNGEQTADPLHLFNNTGAGVSVTGPGGGCGVNPQDFIQENRDYFLTAKPGFTEYPYPHPLAGGETVAPPSTPTNLRVRN